jgi:hypothetical protein
MEFSDGDL